MACSGRFYARARCPLRWLSKLSIRITDRGAQGKVRWACPDTRRKMPGAQIAAQEEEMTKPSAPSPRIPVTDLSDRAPTAFDLRPGAEARAALADRIGIKAIRKLRLAGEIRAEGDADWRLDATLGATVVQDCVVTLAPVTTRLDVVVARRFLAEMPALHPDENGEVQMPEDDTIEPLAAQIDLAAVLEEALTLALPDYPRAEGAGLGDAVHAAPGVVPMRDDDAKPFAGLAALRGKPSTGAEEDDGGDDGSGGANTQG